MNVINKCIWEFFLLFCAKIYPWKCKRRCKFKIGNKKSRRPSYLFMFNNKYLFLKQFCAVKTSSPPYLSVRGLTEFSKGVIFVKSPHFDYTEILISREEFRARCLSLAGSLLKIYPLFPSLRKLTHNKGRHNFSF